jgi:hypothetical protein
MDVAAGNGVRAVSQTSCPGTIPAGKPLGVAPPDIDLRSMGGDAASAGGDAFALSLLRRATRAIA